MPRVGLVRPSSLTRVCSSRPPVHVRASIPPSICIASPNCRVISVVSTEMRMRVRGAPGTRRIAADTPFTLMLPAFEPAPELVVRAPSKT